MTTLKDITKLIEASSLGTRSARAARRTVTAAEGDALARRAARSGQGSRAIPRAIQGYDERPDL